MNKGWTRFMDRRVKERLIGATILVVLIVLIVPELLSGNPSGAPSGSPSVTPSGTPSGGSLIAPPGAPPPEPVRSVTVDLATSKAMPMDDATAPSGASVPDGTPTTANLAANAIANVAATPATPATPAAAANHPPPAAATVGDPSNVATLRAQHAAPPDDEAEPAPPSPTQQRWAVQLGSFASRNNADKLVRRIKVHDPSAYVSPSGSGAALRYRVRVGPLADRGAALRTLAKFKNEGLSASLVPP
jgi:DedD protein